MRRTLFAVLGSSIGQYRIVELLGSGSMGVVYKAVDETLDREVAIKILNPELTDTDLMRRFRTEATTLAKLNHPEIATIYELRPSDQSVVMVMEFVRGEPLDRVLKRAGALPLETVAYMVDRILSALGHAHQAGIVHRDVKPANVMVTASGGIKVMDFGIAFMRDVDQSGAGSGMLGTPAYMPPEQIRGDEIDGRSDLYAVGVIFYRLLTGAFPFRASTIEDMLRQQLSGTPTTPLSEYRAGLPGWCERIVQRALARSPSDRFQTAEEFRSALKEATHAVPERTARLTASALSRLGVARPVAPAVTAPEATAPEPTVALKRRRAVPNSVSIVVTAIAIAVLLYFAPWRLASERRSSTSVSNATTPIQARFEPRLLPFASSPMMMPPSVTPTPPRVVTPPRVAKPVAKRAVETQPDPGADARPAPTTTSPPVESEARRATAAFPPVVFDAKALVGIGDRQIEREVNVQLADGYLAVTAATIPTDVLYRQPFDAIQSIAYSLSRHPLWLSPNGPAPAARTGRVLGIFSRTRHWMTLRGGDAADPSTIVLQFENDEQVRHVVRALAVRTGRTAVRVLEPKDPK